MWDHSSNQDVLIITETWLRKCVLNTDINLSSYNLFRQDILMGRLRIIGVSEGLWPGLLTTSLKECSV
jgi:hypothetical protein